ncbi:MAG TPA: PAS domain S-box protein [Candidatus Binatia bacterium]
MIRKLSAAAPMRLLIPLLTGIGGIVVLVLFTIYQSHNTLAEVEEEARHDLFLMMSNLESSVNYLLRENDIQGVRTVLASEGIHPYIKHLVLVDEVGIILAATGSASDGLPLHATIPELAHVLTICRNGRMPGRTILGFDGNHLLGCYPASSFSGAGSPDRGNKYLLVSYDFSQRKALGEQRSTRLIVLVGSLFVAGFLAVMLMLRHALARRRIALVLSATEKLAAGDLAARVGLRGGDEVATIGEAFDRMADQLQTTTQALETSHAELERRVDERTAELAKANEQLEREISVRTQAERAARRDGDWLRSLIHTSQDAVISIDRQGQIVLFNPSAERIFGYTADEVVGRKVNLLMAEPYAWEHDGYISDYQRTGKARAMGQTRLVMAKRKNGEQFPIEVSLTEVAADENVPYAAFIRDVSERSRLQAQLLESERLAAIGTTAAKIGHEIANPLNGMYLTVQLLEQRLVKELAGSDGQIIANIKKLRDEIARLNQLLQQFRALARRDQYDFRTLHLADLIDDVVAVQQPLCASLAIKIEHHLEPDLPTINGDRDKLKQAILNLLKNSMEAMPAGGRIKITGSASSDMVTIQIADSGAGIPPDIDIFQPFATTKNQGTGLGLVIVRQIVTAHHGTISYLSEPGKGTVFVVSLPRG